MTNLPDAASGAAALANRYRGCAFFLPSSWPPMQSQYVFDRFPCRDALQLITLLACSIYTRRGAFLIPDGADVRAIAPHVRPEPLS
jgi:hypothetical protein